MLGELVQHVGSGSDGVGAQVELQSGFLGCGYETVGGCLVARDVHVAVGRLGLALNLIGVSHGSVCVVSVVISGADDLDVGIGNRRLLGEFLADEVFRNLQVAVEEPAHQTYGEHVAALQHGFVVHSAVGEAVLHHLRDGGSDDILLDAHLLDGVVCLEGGFLQVCCLEGIRVDDDAGGGLGELVLRLQGSGVHRYQYVALVARRVDLVCTDVYLEAGDAGQ